MSKFILALDASQIHEYLTCPLKWYYRYNQNLELNEYAIHRAAPDKGTLVHQLLDLYYNLKTLKPEDNSLAIANIVVEQFKDLKLTRELFPKDNGTLENFLCQRFLLYATRYQHNDFDVIPGGVELGFSKLLYEYEDVKFIVEGRIDLINRILNGHERVPCFTDHKSQERYSDLYKFKIQFRTYAWATGYRYGMVNYFGLQEDNNNDLLKKGKLFRRDLIFFPSEMIKEWEQKLLDIFCEIKYLIQCNNGYKIEERFYTHKKENACSGAFDSNPCQFTSICEEYNWEMKERIKEMKYTKIQPWSPWSLK